LCSVEEIQAIPKSRADFTVLNGYLPACSSKMKTCSEDEYDFVSLYGNDTKYDKSWKENYPDQKKLDEVKFDTGKGKFRPVIKGFHCSCDIDGTESDADGTEKNSKSKSSSSDKSLAAQ
jgi:hypothetical protein